MDPLTERLAKALKNSLAIGAVYLPMFIEVEARMALDAYEVQKALEEGKTTPYGRPHPEQRSERF